MNYLEYSNQGPEIAIYTIFGPSALLIRAIWSQVETGSIFLNNKTLVSFISNNDDGRVAGSVMVVIQGMIIAGPSLLGLCQIIPNYRLQLTQPDFDTNLLFLARSAFTWWNWRVEKYLQKLLYLINVGQKTRKSTWQPGYAVSCICYK